MWIIIGLGNPGKEYEKTRHNTGREILMAIEKKEGKGLPTAKQGTLFGKKATLFYPDVYMNNSGGPIKKLVSSKKAAESLVVLHDELDLPLGKVKISFGSSAGGHKGVKSVQTALKTKDFIRIRIGISPSTSSGRLRRPEGEKIVDFVLGAYKPAELEKLKKVHKVVAEALEILFEHGLSRAMTEINSR
jgi:PTH1 family peptidyl-tRNA hydrolase